MMSLGQLRYFRELLPRCSAPRTQRPLHRYVALREGHDHGIALARRTPDALADLFLVFDLDAAGGRLVSRGCEIGPELAVGRQCNDGAALLVRVQLLAELPPGLGALVREVEEAVSRLCRRWARPIERLHGNPVVAEAHDGRATEAVPRTAARVTTTGALSRRCAMMLDAASEPSAVSGPWVLISRPYQPP